MEEDIPAGLTSGEEWEAIRRMQGREVKGALVDWVVTLAGWTTRADLTFESVAHPERAEKAIRRWKGKVAPAGIMVVGYERQERGATHMHALISGRVDCASAQGEWERIAGWCRVEVIESKGAALEYVAKHAVKGLGFEILGPGKR